MIARSSRACKSLLGSLPGFKELKLDGCGGKGSGATKVTWFPENVLGTWAVSDCSRNDCSRKCCNFFAKGKPQRHL